MQTKRIKTELISITPDIARVWLTKNTNNRNLRLDVAHRYAKDMSEGRWQPSHQGIAFYDDGTLADGQHRLFAVTLHNKPVTFLVTRNLPKASGQMIDQHAPRMAHDAIRIGGGDHWIDRNIVALARFLMSGLGSDAHTKSVAEVQAYIEKYAEPLQFAHGLAPQKRRHLTPAAALACYFCAERAGVARDKLTRFAEIMIRGEIEGPHENAAIRLREHLLQMGGSVWIGGVRVETAKKVQKAVQVFVSGRPISKLVMPDNFIYPIPV